MKKYEKFALGVVAVGVFMMLFSLKTEAKEVVAAPVVVEEAVQIPIPQPIVEEKKFIPSGAVTVEYRVWDKAEHDDITQKTGRLQTSGSYRFTEKVKFDFRQRTYNSLTQDEKYGDLHGKNNDTRIRGYYSHDKIGKMYPTSRVYFHYYNSNDAYRYEYMYRMNVTDYVAFDKFGVKLDSLVIAPKIRYQESGIRETVKSGADVELALTLPAEVYVYTNLYLEHDENKNSYYNTRETVAWEFYIGRDFELYKNGKHKVVLNVEAGVDPYVHTNRSIFSRHNVDISNNASLYVMPDVKYTYKANETVSMYTSLGAEYRNHQFDEVGKSKDWRWMPTATVGFSVNI